MNDQQFDELARRALAFDPGSPNEAAWKRVKPVRWAWLPTVPEILACSSCCALALLVVGLRIRRGGNMTSQPSPVIENAVYREPPSLVASVTRIDYPIGRAITR